MSNVLIRVYIGHKPPTPHYEVDINKLWPVLQKIREDAQADIRLLPEWLEIARGLYAVDKKILYAAAVRFIETKNKLPAASQTTNEN